MQGSILSACLAGLFCCCFVGSVNAEDYYSNDTNYGEESNNRSDSSNSGMFYYDYADGPGSIAAPSAPRQTTHKAPQVVVVAPPHEVDNGRPKVPAKTKQLSPAPKPKLITTPKKQVSQPPKKAALTTLYSERVEAIKKQESKVAPTPRSVSPAAENIGVASENNDKTRKITVLQPPPEKKQVQKAEPATDDLPVTRNIVLTHEPVEIPVQKKVEKNTIQKAIEKDLVLTHKSAESPVQKSTIGESKNSIEKPASIPGEKLPVKEFIADPVSGKPAVGNDGNLVHFYSDESPLVPPPPPDPDYDPDFADFELSRVLPVINAPDGIYGFSFVGEGLQISASQTYAGVQIQASQTIALNMTITNNSGTTHNFIEKVTAPDGIKAVHEIAGFEIAAGRSTVRRLSLQLDSALNAGEHQVNYAVNCVDDKAVSGKLDFNFAIRPVQRLQLALDPSADGVIENEKFKLTGKIINTGNTGVNAHLNIKGKKNNGLSIVPARLSLPAGGFAIVELEGVAPSREHPLDDLMQINLSAITDKKSGSMQLLDEPIKIRIADKGQS